MAPSDQYEDNDRLYLDDLYIGQRFTSRSHALDEAQIKAFAGQFDPQPFHLDSAAKGTLFAGQARGEEARFRQLVQAHHYWGPCPRSARRRPGKRNG
jgi:acyl dehydratase